MPSIVDRLALALAAVGAVNWGLVGLFDFDLVATVTGERFGRANPATRTVYGLVGVAGIAVLATHVVRTESEAGS